MRNIDHAEMMLVAGGAEDVPFHSSGPTPEEVEMQMQQLLGLIEDQFRRNGYG